MHKRYGEIQSRGLTLRGYLELPDGASAKNPAPLLVMFHGFTGTLSEKHFLLSRLSRAIVTNGIATLRLDFGGSGESDGEFLDVTPATEIADGHAIYEYALEIPEADHARTGLFGYSLGGCIATNVAALERNRVRGLALLSPGARTHLKMQKLLEETGRCGRGSLVLTEQFVKDGLEHEGFAAAHDYHGPVRIVQGTADDAVPTETAAEYEAAFSHATVAYVEGANHSYDSPEFFSQMVAEMTAAVTELLAS